MTDAERDALKAYMRVETDDDDDVIEALWEAAGNYLANAGCDVSAGASLYTLARQSLTLYYYDHRDDADTEAQLPAGVRPIITQLKVRSNTAM